MSETSLRLSDMNLDDYAILPAEPAPPDETPRQFLLRMTGKNFSGLTVGFGPLDDGSRDLTWQEVEDAGGLPIISNIMQIAYRPCIKMRKKNP